MPVKLGPQTDKLFRHKDVSFWNLWKHGVTSSFIDKFDTCREQTRIHYVLGMESRKIPLAIEYGNCGHYVLEQAYGKYFKEVKRIVNDGPDRLRAFVQDLVKGYEVVWNSRVTNPTIKQLQQQEKIYGLVEASLPHYFRRWCGDFTGTYPKGTPTTKPRVWTSLEKVFCCPYYYPDGKGTWLRGRRDGTFLDARTKTWVIDHKFRSVVNDYDLVTLPFDLQQMMYLWITHLEMSEKAGKPVYPAGTIVNIPRRPGHYQGKTESLQDYCERVYRDLAKAKNWDHFYIRWEMAITPSELISWKKNTFDPLMQEVRMWWEGSLPHRMRGSSLTTKYGPCQLFDYLTTGDNSDLYRRKHVFAELPEVG